MKSRIITLIAATALFGSVAPASADVRLTDREARASVEAVNVSPSPERSAFAQHVVFTQDVADGYVRLVDGERIGPRRIRYWADAWVSTRFADGSVSEQFHYAGVRHVTIVKRRSGAIIARSTVVLKSGDAFTVGYPMTIG